MVREKRKQCITVRAVSPEMKVQKSAQTSSAKPKRQKTDMSVSHHKPGTLQQSIKGFMKSSNSVTTDQSQKELPSKYFGSEKGTPDKSVELYESDSSDDSAQPDESVKNYEPTNLRSSSNNCESNADIESVELPNSAIIESETESGQLITSRASVLVPKKQYSKKPKFLMPVWLQKYFEYNGHVDGCTNQKDSVAMTCKLCPNSTPKFGSPFHNFKRHLKSVHPDDFETELKNGNVDNFGKKELTTNVGLNNVKNHFAPTKWKKPTNANAFNSSHPVQARFTKDLLDCVAIDGLPIDFIERRSFIKLVRNLNSNVRLFSRRTLGRRLSMFYKSEFKSKIKTLLSNLDPQTLHLILDLWTDRMKSAMIGIKCQFVSANWSIHNFAIAFREFNDHHTAKAIRKILEDVLRDTFSVQLQKVGFVIGDNASNIKAAFQSDSKLSFNDESDCSDTEDVSDDENSWLDFDEFMDPSSEDESDTDTVERVELPCELGAAKLVKLACFCHLLQLIIQDALTSIPAVNAIVKDVKKLKQFFRRSTYWYDRFKKLAGKGLVHQADTRWNTVFFVMERLGDVKVQEALNTVLNETRKSDKPCKVSFSVGDYAKMKIIATLLEPFKELTNMLQGDGVTSSIVIPGLSSLYKTIVEMDVGDDDDAQKLQERLCECLIERFKTGLLNCTTMQPQLPRLKRIARDEVFRNKQLIVATMLDPRFKTVPFLDTTEQLNNEGCSESNAIKVLQEEFRAKQGLMKTTHSASQPDDVNSQSSETNRKSFFHHFHQSKAKKVASGDSERQEIKDYLNMPMENENSNPLQFWKKHEHDFPVLSKLAKIYLGFPASSGSAERLFSIAGALQRSRRASLKWSTIEKLLCYREARIMELFGGYV